MMVCGSMVSSDALAGAVSGSKAVPVTTTVSTSPALSAVVADGEFAATFCCAWAFPANTAPANRARAAVELRNRLDLAEIIEKPLEFKNTAGPNRCAHAIA